MIANLWGEGDNKSVSSNKFLSTDYILFSITFFFFLITHDISFALMLCWLQQTFPPKDFMFLMSGFCSHQYVITTVATFLSVFSLCSHQREISQIKCGQS